MRGTLLLVAALLCACSAKPKDNGPKTREQLIAEAYERQRAQEERDRMPHPEPPPQPPSVETAKEPAPIAHALTIKGQLDRIASENRAEDSDDYKGDVAKFRKMTGWTDALNPSVVYNRFTNYFREAEAAPITYPMLKKNAGRYAGKSWALLNAKIVEIQEKDGATIARVDAGGGNTVFVAGRFLTDLVEGQRTDVAGYLAGNFEYTSRANWKLSIPALAAGGMFKGGSFDRMAEEVIRVQKKK